MNQYEPVIKIMEENGGFATLGFLNENVLKIKDCEWKTKTPFASIRRIVQDQRFFFKIKPGLWALKSYKSKLPKEILPDEKTTIEKKTEYNHSYYQGLLVELGNIQSYQTYVPNQDKNKMFLNKKLSEITSLTNIYNFAYDDLLKEAKTVDVIWFNIRKMPSKFFEIEHSTNIEHSILKFNELQDFHSNFYIVADEIRKNEYEKIIKKISFVNIKNRIKYIEYNKLSEWHTKEYELHVIKQSFKDII